jgi:hypothetical protein
MTHHLTLSDPILSTAEIARVTGLRRMDAENWIGQLGIGTLVPEGRRNFRRFSVEDALVLRVLLALTGPTTHGTCLRSFMPPAAAYMIVKVLAPLSAYIALDGGGYVKPSDTPAFMVVRCLGSDDHITCDVLSGREVVQAFNEITSQMMVIPLSKLVHETVIACGDIVKASGKYNAAVARLAQATERVPGPVRAEGDD